MAKTPEGAAELVLSTDGASRGNPGPSGAGVVLATREGSPLVEKAVFLGQGTNNAAEYRALLIGLEEAQRLAPRHLTVRMDSELIVKQLNGQYRVRHPALIPLHRKAQALIRQIGAVRILHVPREQNQQADRLANRAIDDRLAD